VPAKALSRLLKGLNAVTKPGGTTTHSIDYSDHCVRSDAQVCRSNFLRFSDSQGAKYNSSLQYVNRLRHSDYLRLSVMRASPSCTRARCLENLHLKSARP
jgi:hypothetical protein